MKEMSLHNSYHAVVRLLKGTGVMAVQNTEAERKSKNTITDLPPTPQYKSTPSTHPIPPIVCFNNNEMAFLSFSETSQWMWKCRNDGKFHIHLGSGESASPASCKTSATSTNFIHPKNILGRNAESKKRSTSNNRIVLPWPTYRKPRGKRVVETHP